MSFIFRLVGILCALNLQAQVTFRVVSLPANTPANAEIFIAGSFNGWDENSPDYRLNGSINGDPSITLPLNGSITCKFTRGSWAAVEGNANGGFLPDRQYTVAPFDTIEVTILSWEDLGGGNTGGTALPSVSVMAESFFMPQLNRSRRIWICLPEDYATQPTKRYRTVYMHDGQNLFNNALAFAGEWGVDESMRNLQLSGDAGAIVIGIENGGASRISEYTPWTNPQYGGGDGEAYSEFIRNTLKPYVDANYRTRPEAEHTAIAGSSLGGLISLYAAARYPETFGKVGVFSPAFWINRDSLQLWLANQSLPESMRVYFVAGTTESSSMMSDINAVRGILNTSGVAASNLRVVGEADGAHSEWFWRREYPDAYLWLFGESTSMEKAVLPGFSAYPNPVDSGFTLCAENKAAFEFQVSTLDGRTILQKQQADACAVVDCSLWESGVYLVWVGMNHGVMQPMRVVKP